MEKIKNILCVYPEPAELRISALLNRHGIVVDLTEASHPDAVKAALDQPLWWDLILCDAAAFFDKGIASEIDPVRDSLEASLVLLKDSKSALRPAESLSYGAADVVDRDDVDHLLMVCEREVRNAATRKQLRALRHSVANESGGRSQFMVPTINDLSKRVHPSGGADGEAGKTEPMELDRMRTLIDGGGLTLEYQPIVAFRPEGQHRNMFETLVRLKDETGQLLLPDRFLPLAADAGWIGNIDLWICRQAIAVLEQMQSSGARDTTLFVNLSTQTLKSEKQVRAIGTFFTAAHLTPGSIVVEVKKSAFEEAGDGISRLAEMLKVKQHGVLLEDPRLDDRELLESHRALITHVKLSSATVQGLVEGAASQQALNAFVRCAHREGMQVIALAIENVALMPILFAAGIDAIQGNFTCVPNQELVYPSVTMIESAPII
ncbi:EAL domain-containing protein [Thiorhodococcus mannitoliphagus]|uniref:EAL domain-containing protein n=1 Tax=Thiorhodococcus mannitoliphagus TaxID=329406 RepID=A0A6P1DR81_9GAMM|nr:EAL domain-containing protein [Thiorhodococcus mannitoliphagus]NEX20050.1 EAL domain-containing protein [Thiorhodococcus mannitoliphagus]